VAEEDRIPDRLVGEMRELGLFGLSIPEEYGGLGLSMFEEAQVAFRLGKTSPAFRSLIGTNNGIGSQGIVLDGTDEQKTRWLPRLASGEIIGSFCLTEPDTGSDAGALRTTARREGNDSFVLNGTKRYITNAPEAGLFTVFARTDLASSDAKGVSAFLVEAGTPGVIIGRPDRKMGQQGAHIADVVFENARVPLDAIIGGPPKEGQGFKTAMKVLDRGRLNIAAVCVGAAERLIADSLAYAMDRRQFGQPIAEFQLIRPCWRTRRPRLTRRAAWLRKPPAAAMPGRTSRRKRPAASSTPARWSGAWPTVPCRSMAAPAISPITAWSASIAMSGCSAFTRAPAKSNSLSSPAT
jgi:acyl-CoA dehydrogenase